MSSGASPLLVSVRVAVSLTPFARRVSTPLALMRLKTRVVGERHALGVRQPQRRPGGRGDVAQDEHDVVLVALPLPLLERHDVGVRLHRAVGVLQREDADLAPLVRVVLEGC